MLQKCMNYNYNYFSYDRQWDSSVYDVNYESFDSILCLNRS